MWQHMYWNETFETSESSQEDVSESFILPPGSTFKLCHFWHPFSQCPSLSFWCYSVLPPLFNSCGAGLGSRESLSLSLTDTDTHTHTYTEREGCATVRLQCRRGCGDTGLYFPMPIVNCRLYLKLWGDLHCPLDPSPGPWPLAQRLCPLPCWDTQWTLCMCVLCVLMAHLKRGSVIQPSAIQPPASTLRASSPMPKASHLSWKDKLQSFSPP